MRWGTTRCPIARRTGAGVVAPPLLAEHYPEYAPPVTGQYFNQRKTTIYAGSTEIQKNIIAQIGLGSLRRRRWISVIPKSNWRCRTPCDA